MKNKKSILLISLLLVVLCLSGCSKKSGEDPFDFSGIEPKDLNPWTYIEDTSLSMNSAATKLASSSGALGITIGIMGIVFSIFYMAIRIFFTKSAAAKEEVKREAVMKGMIAIMLFSIPFWLGLFKQFSELLI